jgi:hypothetical protein
MTYAIKFATASGTEMDGFLFESESLARQAAEKIFVTRTGVRAIGLLQGKDFEVGDTITTIDAYNGQWRGR